MWSTKEMARPACSEFGPSQCDRDSRARSLIFLSIRIYHTGKSFLEWRLVRPYQVIYNRSRVYNGLGIFLGKSLPPFCPFELPASFRTPFPPPEFCCYTFSLSVLSFSFLLIPYPAINFRLLPHSFCQDWTTLSTMDTAHFDFDVLPFLSSSSSSSSNVSSQQPLPPQTMSPTMPMPPPLPPTASINGNGGSGSSSGGRKWVIVSRMLAFMCITIAH